MSSVVFNGSAVGKSTAATAELFPTTIGGASKIYRYQHIMPAPELKSGAGGGGGGGVSLIKTRKYTPRGMALANASKNSNNNNSNNNSSNNSSSRSSSSNSSSSSCCSTSPYSVDQSQSVQRRNARERNRVKQVNNSFARLRQHIPQSIIADLTKGGGRGPHKKISKVDTLRIAVEYIRRLQDLVDDLNGGHTNTSSSNSNSNSSNSSNSNSSNSSSNSISVSQLNLCLDETSSQSSTSSTSSTSSSSASQQMAQQLYYSSALLAPGTVVPPTALQQQQQLQRQQYPNHPLTPITLNVNSQQLGGGTPTVLGTSNVAGCHSPTSSFNSSMSFDSGTYEATQPTAMDAQLQLKFEPYEHFQLDEEDCTPDDEEILDYISLWQEQ